MICRLVYDICTHYWVSHELKPIVCGVFKTTIAPRSARLRPCVHRIEQMPLAQLRPHTVEISVFPNDFWIFFFKIPRSNRLKEPTLKFHPRLIFVSTSEKLSGGFPDFRHFFLKKNRRHLDWCWLALTAVLLQSCHLAVPKFSRLQQLQQLGWST